MAIYCYRSQVNRLIETNSLTDSFGTPLCAHGTDDDDLQFDHDGLVLSDGLFFLNFFIYVITSIF